VNSPYVLIRLGGTLLGDNAVEPVVAPSSATDATTESWLATTACVSAGHFAV